MSDRTRASSFQDQAARPAGRSDYLRMRIAPHHRQRTSKSDLEFELLLLALASVRQIGNEPQPCPQLRDRLDETRLCDGMAARLAPISDRFLEETCFAEVVRESFRPPLHHIGKPLLKDAGDLSVQ